MKRWWAQIVFMLRLIGEKFLACELHSILSYCGCWCCCCCCAWKGKCTEDSPSTRLIIVMKVVWMNHEAIRWAAASNYQHNLQMGDENENAARAEARPRRLGDLISSFIWSFTPRRPTKVLSFTKQRISHALAEDSIVISWWDAKKLGKQFVEEGLDGMG